MKNILVGFLFPWPCPMEEPMYVAEREEPGWRHHKQVLLVGASPTPIRMKCGCHTPRIHSLFETIAPRTPAPQHGVSLERDLFTLFRSDRSGH